MSKVPRSNIAKIIGDQSLKTTNSKTLATSTAAYLLDTGRAGELSSILRDVQQYRAGKGVVEVTAVSTHTLTDATRKDIEKQIIKIYPDVKQIIISEKIDPYVLGGVRLELANQQLDLTARAKLNKLKTLTA